VNASHGTDIVCFMTDGRWPEPTRLNQLADYEIFSEKTFEEPPQLLIAYNITKDERNRFGPAIHNPAFLLPIRRTAPRSFTHGASTRQMQDGSS
jgi:hypothetical protein